MKEFMGLLDVDAVGKYLGVSVRTVHRLLKSGRKHLACRGSDNIRDTGDGSGSHRR